MSVEPQKPGTVSRLPVDRPCYASGGLDRKILLYEACNKRRLAGAGRAIESRATDASVPQFVIAAQQALDDADREAAMRTRDRADPATVAAEPTHQFLYNQLVSSGHRANFRAGVAQYVDREFAVDSEPMAGDHAASDFIRAATP